MPLRIIEATVEPTAEPDDASPVYILEYPTNSSLRDQIVWYRKRFLELAGEAQHVGERANCLKLTLAATLKAEEVAPSEVAPPKKLPLANLRAVIGLDDNDN
jgi:hypothetical protein